MYDDAMVQTTSLSPVLGRYFEIGWDRGAGHRLFDSAGRSYLDFACGIAVTALGHGHPRVNAAIHAQVDRLVHASNGLGYFEPVSRLAERLAGSLPERLDSVFLANSGTEAVEAALKLARRVTGRPGYVAFSGSFHGRTFGSLSVTSSNPGYRRGHEPLLPGVAFASFPDQHDDQGPERAAAMALAQLRATLESTAAATFAALIVEPIQGEGGFNVAAPSFLAGLRAIADEAGGLLIVDEIQTGLGRTGWMWAFEAAGVVPDVVCVGKALANGLPLSAMVSARELQERWGRGAHGTTFGGNPVACAAGLAVLETIEAEGLVENAARMGRLLRAGLDPLAAQDPRIAQVRGAGLMLGVELRDPASGMPGGDLANAVIARCADEGLLLLTCGTGHEVVRWLPPLDVTADEVEEGLAIFGSALARL
jgi:4-aminobutyrate aminotransferase